MTDINFDISGKVSLQLLSDHSVYAEFEFYEDASGTQPLALEGTLKLKAKNSALQESIEIAEGNQVKKAGHRLIVDFKSDENPFKKGLWKFEVRADQQDNTSIPYLSGEIKGNSNT